MALALFETPMILHEGWPTRRWFGISRSETPFAMLSLTAIGLSPTTLMLCYDDSHCHQPTALMPYQQCLGHRCCIFSLDISANSKLDIRKSEVGLRDLNGVDPWGGKTWSWNSRASVLEKTCETYMELHDKGCIWSAAGTYYLDTRERVEIHFEPVLTKITLLTF